jgi:hypothetical protein
MIISAVETIMKVLNAKNGYVIPNLSSFSIPGSTEISPMLTLLSSRLDPRLALG